MYSWKGFIQSAYLSYPIGTRQVAVNGMVPLYGQTLECGIFFTTVLMATIPQRLGFSIRVVYCTESRLIYLLMWKGRRGTALRGPITTENSDRIPARRSAQVPAPPQPASSSLFSSSLLLLFFDFNIRLCAATSSRSGAG